MAGRGGVIGIYCLIYAANRRVWSTMGSNDKKDNPDRRGRFVAVQIFLTNDFDLFHLRLVYTIFKLFLT